MYATHHKTGRKVRILNQSTSTWKDKKSLVWCDPSNIDENVPWNRFDIGCVSVKNYNLLLEKNIEPDILVCLSKDDVSWIRKNVKKVKMIFASTEILNELTESFFQENRVSNVLCLNELHLLYSFLETEWDGSVEDACILVALVLRFSETFPLVKCGRKTYGLKVLCEMKKPNQLWFITQYYIPKELNRRVELMKTLSKNIQNTYIDKIILLNETSVKYEKSSKIEEVLIGKRMFYNDVFNYIYNNVPDDVTVVFANSDIYLDETIRNVWAVNMENKFFALLRYENGEIYGPRVDSQDCWIVSSSSVKSRSNNYKDLEFSFGVMGCDNAITLEMMRQKYLVVNPALTIKTHHLHDSGVRHYNTDDIVEKDTYLYIEATGLHDMEAVVNINKPVEKKYDFDSFDREIHCSNDNRARTFCTMISKQDRYKYSMSKNTYTPQSVNIYRLENVFQTNTGLVYDYNKIYVGKSKVSKEAWAESSISTLTPSIMCDTVYVSYLPNSYIENIEKYVLYYLSNILLMKATIQKDGEFWCMNDPFFVNLMKLFKWNQKTMPLLSRGENELTFAKEAYVWLASDENEVTKEQMNALRTFMRTFSSNEKSVVVFIDNTYVNEEFVKSLETIYLNVNCIYTGTSIERKIAYLQNASLVILSSSISSITAYGWLWCVKQDTKVYDIQNEMNMNGEVLHIANACELNYQFITVPKGLLTVQLTNKILNEVKEFDINTKTDKTPVVNKTPVVLVPKNDDKNSFFYHSGDSFREIIDMWAERKYVKKEVADCKNVWLNSVGDTLLYDRPNYDWIKNAPAEEQVWKNALFGNPKPLGGKAKAWSFWPRRPRLVEAMLDKEVKKTKNIVFYGKIENAVQKKHRTVYDWSSVCDASEFVMVNENESPKYSEQEYIDKISQSHYGLCLAGYGKKCHREVECMAFGTVPVIAPEVDMESYANPPIEGLHYIRVKNPEDLKEKLAQIDDDVWYRMSQACKQWYKENCSVDGMWELTKKLLL